MNRKAFIKNCGYVCIGGTALSAILESCTGTKYIAQTAATNNQLLVKKSEFIESGSNKAMNGKYVLLKSDKYNFPIGVYKTDEDGYSALLMECTHRGCELQPQGDYLICPCHGSEFTNKGIVQNPPAEENLKTFKITTDHENVYIQL